MEETYIPRREFHKKTTESIQRKSPQRRSYSTSPKKGTTVRLADIILMQGIVCTLLFAIIVCIRVINTDFTIEVREKLKTAMSEQLTLEDASNIIDEGKTKLTALQQTVKTTFGFQEEPTPETIQHETGIMNEQPESNQVINNESTNNYTEPIVITEVPISDSAEAVTNGKGQTDEAIVDEEILHQINNEFNDTAAEKKPEPLREITPPSEGI